MQKQLNLDFGIEEVADAPSRPFKVVTTSFYEERDDNGVRRVRCVQHETQDIRTSPHNPIQSYRSYYL